MSVTVLLFASLAEAVGTRRLDVAAEPGDTVATVRDRVVAAHPQLARFVPTLMVAVDEVYATDDDPVPPGATVALIPPVSGG
ncbi:MAG: molybdopterin converting factor subunit 1 [Dehalococcoidia bacterium]